MTINHNIYFQNVNKPLMQEILIKKMILWLIEITVSTFQYQIYNQATKKLEYKKKITQYLNRLEH